MYQYVKAYYLSCLKFFTAILVIYVVRIIWKKFLSSYVEVNCWFCNKYSLIIRKDRNNFFCVHCDQYNGFNDEGDYNCDIDVDKSNSVLRSYPRKVVENSNYFCNSCENFQNYKLQLYSNFVPKNEVTFEEEFSEYKDRVEKAYGLCNACERIVSEKINKDNNVVLPDYIKWTVTPKPKKTYRCVMHLSNLVIFSSLILKFFIYLNFKWFSQKLLPGYREGLLLILLVIITAAIIVSHYTSHFRLSYMHLMLFSMLIVYDHMIARFKYETFLYRLPLLFIISISMLTIMINYIIFYKHSNKQPVSKHVGLQAPVLLTKHYYTCQPSRPSRPSSVCSNHSNYFSSTMIEPEGRSVFSAPHRPRTPVSFRNSRLNYVNTPSCYQSSSVGANNQTNCNMSIQGLHISSPPHHSSNGSIDQFDSVSQYNAPLSFKSNGRPTLSRMSHVSRSSYNSLRSCASVGTPVKHDSNVVAFIKFALSALAVQVIFYLIKIYFH